MKFLAALFIFLLLMGSNAVFAQDIDRTELFSELNAIRTDRSCNALEAKKLFYFRKGPKTRASYQVEKDVLSGIQEVFPDQSFFDVSGLGLLAKLDQGGSDQYVDMIKASLQAVNEPGLYIHADFSNLEGSEMLEIQAWTIERTGSEMQPKCLQRSILFRNEAETTNFHEPTQTLNIDGDVINSGSGNININQQSINLGKSPTEFNSLEDVLTYLSFAEYSDTASQTIPIKYGSQLSHDILIRLSTNATSNEAFDDDTAGNVMFKDGEYNFRYKDDYIIEEKWTINQEFPTKDRVLDFNKDTGQIQNFVHLKRIDVVLGVDSFSDITEKAFSVDRIRTDVEIDCWPSVMYNRYPETEYFTLICRKINFHLEEFYIFKGKLMDDLFSYPFHRAMDLMMRSNFIPLEVYVFHGEQSPCITGHRHAERNTRQETVHINPCIEYPTEGFVPWSYHTKDKDAYHDINLPEIFNKITSYTAYRFITENYFPTPVSRLKFSQIYDKTSSLSYLGSSIPGQRAIDLRMWPYENGWTLDTLRVENIAWSVIEDNIASISFTAYQCAKSTQSNLFRKLIIDLKVLIGGLDYHIVEERVRLADEVNLGQQICNPWLLD